MAANVWSSAASTDGNAVANWSLGALAASDTLTFDATSVINCTFTAAISCAGVSVIAAYTGALSDGGQAFTVGGTVAITSGGAVTISGAMGITGDFTLGSAATMTSSTLTFTGTAAQTLTSGGVTLNNVTINRSTAGTFLFSGATSLATLTASGTNTQAISWTGTTMTSSANITLDGSGTLNCGTAVTMNGASSNFHLGSGLGTVTATSCVLTMNTATAGVIDVDKASTFGPVTINGVVANTGSAVLSLTNNTTALTLTSSSALTLTSGLTLALTASCTPLSLGAGYTIAGANGFIFYNGTPGITLTIPALTMVGSLQMREQGTTGTTTYNQAGNISAAAISIFSGGGNTVVYNTQNYSITASGAFAIGSSFTLSFTFNAGSSAISVASYAATWNYGAGGTTTTINMSSSQWTCTGAWTFGSNHTINAGTSLVTFSGTAAQTITMAGKCLYDITINRTTAGTLTFADAVCARTVVVSATNTQAVSWTGTTMSVSGNLTIDGSGTLNCGNGITATGASSEFHIGSTVGTITASSCVITMSTNTAGIIDIDRSNVFSRIVISASAIVTNSGTSPLRFGGSTAGHTSLTLAGNSSLTDNAGIQFFPSAATWTLVSFGAGATWTGSGNIILYQEVAATVTIPAFTYSGTGSFTCSPDNSNVSVTYNVTGNISLKVLSFAYTHGAGAPTLTWNFGSASLTATAVSVGNSTATGTLVMNWGSGSHSWSSFSGSGTSTVTHNFQSCNISVSGSWWHDTDNVVNPGSSTVTFTNTASITSVSKAFFNLIINAAGKTITLADDLTIATGGSLTVTAFTAFAGGKYLIFAGSGSITISAAVSNRLRTAVAGSTITWNTGANVWTVPAYIASDWGPAAGANVSWGSSAPGTPYRISAPAGITLSRMTVRDCINSGTSISSPWTNDCRSGGGNTGVVFGTTLTAAAAPAAVVCTGTAFASNQYAPTGRIELRVNGTVPWALAAVGYVWGDTSASGTFAGLPSAIYDVRITSGDGEQATLLAAFSVSTSSSAGFLNYW